MKSLTSYLKESLELQINESAVIDFVVDYDDDADNREEVAHAIDKYISAIEDIKVNDLKRIRDWKDYDKDRLEDYRLICEHIAAFFWGIQSLAEDDSDEANNFNGAVSGIVDIEDWVGFNSVLDDIWTEDFKTCNENEDLQKEYLIDILNHWNDLSKIVNKIKWS